MSFQWASPSPLEYIYGPTTILPTILLLDPDLGLAHTAMTRLIFSRYSFGMSKTNDSLNTGLEMSRFRNVDVFFVLIVFPPETIDILTYTPVKINDWINKWTNENRNYLTSELLIWMCGESKDEKINELSNE